MTTPAPTHRPWPLAALAVILTGTLAHTHAADPVQPVDFSTLQAGFEVEPLDRLIAHEQLYGDHSSEAFKLSALAELQRKQQAYGDRLAGHRPRKAMPVWQSIGPTSDRFITNGVTLEARVDSGRIATIVPHPTDPNTVYVLSSGGGLWKTTNFFTIPSEPATVWQPKTDALISTSGGSMALGGRDPNTIYLGIGDSFDALSLIAGVMVKSNDGGDTWGPPVSLPGASAVREIQVDSTDPTDVVLVAADTGLFRSADGGVTYAPVAAGSGEAFYHKSIWSLCKTSAGWLASAMDGVLFGNGSVFLSTDRGATWQAVSGTPFADGHWVLGLQYGYYDFSFVYTGRMTLRTAVPGDPVVYAYAGSADGLIQDDLYASSDGGLTWTRMYVTQRQLTNPNEDQRDMNLLGGQAYYNQMLAVDPADPARLTIYLGGQLSTAKSIDGGVTWSLISNWLPRYSTHYLSYVHADQHAAAFGNFRGSSVLLIGTDGGIFYTIGGNGFRDKNSGLVTHLTQTVASAGVNADTALTGMQDDGVRQRLDATGTWDQVIGGDGEGVAWSKANNAVALGSIYYSLIYRHEDQPSNPVPGGWADATNGIGGSDYYPFYTPLATPTAAADPSGQMFFTSTGSKLYRTVDGARSWQPIYTSGDPYAPVFTFNMSHNVIGIHPADPQRIAMAGTTGRAFVTSDGGGSWTNTDISTKVAHYGGRNLSPTWTANGILYMASGSTDPKATRVVKSRDGGTGWRAADRGLPKVPVDQVLADPRDLEGRTVYAATWLGVYVTTNGGEKWRPLGSGLPNVWVKSMELSPTGVMRIATYGRGIWQITLAGKVWDGERCRDND